MVSQVSVRKRANCRRREARTSIVQEGCVDTRTEYGGDGFGDVSAACAALARHWVRGVLRPSGFPLVEALSSADSKAARVPFVRRPRRSCGLIRLLQTVRHRFRLSPLPARPRLRLAGQFAGLTGSRHMACERARIL